ncbi:MAG TPA: amino acid permease [Terriglobia bacterium]|nr:amino acid permease [Terriglobia bacterium]
MTIASDSSGGRELARRLSLGDSLAIVAGIMIGGGIFLVPNLVARSLPSVPMIMGVWVVAGLISLVGALACAELGAAFPATGGQYVFVREAFGPLAAFLCGWSFLTVSRSAQVAWLAVVFSLYVSYFTPVSPLASKVLSLALLAAFTSANYRGVRLGAAIQKSFTLAKIGGALIIIAAALLLSGHARHFAAAAPGASGISPGSFGVALIACLLAYDGWVQLSFVAGEIRDPQRNIVWALVLGTLAVMAVYLLANLAYLRVLSIPEIAASNHVGGDAAGRVLGAAGGSLVSLIILISIAGTLNGCFLTTPRVYFAQARDGLFFRKFADVHSRYGTPAFAILVQGLWGAVLVLSGSYESLADYALFGMWVFYGLMVAAVIVLRRTRADVPRPYRMFGYPVTPLLFLAVTVWFLGNMLVTRPAPALAGLGLMLTGLPAYLVWKRYARQPQASLATATQPVVPEAHP